MRPISRRRQPDLRAVDRDHDRVQVPRHRQQHVDEEHAPQLLVQEQLERAAGMRLRVRRMRPGKREPAAREHGDRDERQRGQHARTPRRSRRGRS